MRDEMTLDAFTDFANDLSRLMHKALQAHPGKETEVFSVVAMVLADTSRSGFGDEIIESIVECLRDRVGRPLPQVLQ